MKLWLLRPIEGDALWEPWYDKAFGFVVRAETEADARALALTDSGEETFDLLGPDTDRAAWESAHSTCVELLPDGEPGVVMRDYASS